MAIVLRNGAVFLHIPKTGGNWVRRVLYQNNLVKGHISYKHADALRVLTHAGNGTKRIGRFYFDRIRLLGPKLQQKPFMFTFVRHPLNWYESYFRYMKDPVRSWRDWGELLNINQWHPNSMLNGLGDNDFNTFITNVVARHPGYVTEMYSWYTHPYVDFVGTQENLREDLITVLKMLNLEFDEDRIRNEPRTNESAKKEDSIEWDPQLREEVMRLEYGALRKYGYVADPIARQPST